MAKKKRIKPLEWVGDRLRYACGSLSKDARILITIFMVLTLSGLSIYFTISSIYRMAKGMAKGCRLTTSSGWNWNSGRSNRSWTV